MATLGENDIRYLMEFWKQNCDDLCGHCANYIPCEGNDCESFEHLVVEELGLPRTEWNKDKLFSCMDRDFGTCRKLENTQCAVCSQDKWGKGFKWDGKPLSTAGDLISF